MGLVKVIEGDKEVVEDEVEGEGCSPTDTTNEGDGGDNDVGSTPCPVRLSITWHDSHSGVTGK